MTTREFKMTLGPTGVGSVVFDGKDWASAITGVTYETESGQLSTLALHISVPEVEIEGHAEIVISEDVHELLRQFGWTPPKLARINTASTRFVSYARVEPPGA